MLTIYSRVERCENSGIRVELKCLLFGYLVQSILEMKVKGRKRVVEWKNIICFKSNSKGLKFVKVQIKFNLRMFLSYSFEWNVLKWYIKTLDYIFNRKQWMIYY